MSIDRPPPWSNLSLSRTAYSSSSCYNDSLFRDVHITWILLIFMQIGIKWRHTRQEIIRWTWPLILSSRVACVWWNAPYRRCTNYTTVNVSTVRRYTDKLQSNLWRNVHLTNCWYWHLILICFNTNMLFVFIDFVCIISVCETVSTGVDHWWEYSYNHLSRCQV